MTLSLITGPFRIIRMPQGVLSTIYWTIRSWLWNYPITEDFGIWKEGNPADVEAWAKNRKRILHTWSFFLRPFFISQGYSLYVHKDPKAFCSSLIPCTKRTTAEMLFPFAQYCCENDSQLEFDFISPLVWPARNKNGQDVVIKAISGASPTNELIAFRLLHSDSLRDDPRNHTIPILEYIKFEEQVFAVMPRWGKAYRGDFVNVGELVRYGRAFFEAVAFLHEHKIAHGDILLQNMFMDVIVPSDLRPLLAGLRGIERKYALIDFETAKVLADQSQSPTELERAFRYDVCLLAAALEINLRCIEDVLPDLGRLFDSMKDSDGSSQPTAASALARFDEICMTLRQEDFGRQVEATRWISGKMEYRKGPPVYLASN